MALWTRRQETGPHASVAAPIAPTTDQAVHSFRAWTESLQITGRLRSNDRLSDALNRREHLRVEGPVVIPIGAATSARYQALEMSVDPFDLEVVVGAVTSAGQDYGDYVQQMARWVARR
jgi:4-hydroxy-3-methylbut-2-enyl diphosphate reductase IspH